MNRLARVAIAADVGLVCTSVIWYATKWTGAPRWLAYFCTGTIALQSLVAVMKNAFAPSSLNDPAPGRKQ